jgi:hypothetical protein
MEPCYKVKTGSVNPITPCNPVKIAASIIDYLLYFLVLNKQWWAYVTVTPHDNSIAVYNKGSSKETFFKNISQQR